MDLFMENGSLSAAWKPGKFLKRVIWAPHWTVGEADSFFSTSTFLQYADFMLELARKYSSQIQFCFKPHPMLHNRLCRLEGWGRERADAYYRKWQELPNAQYNNGEYVGLFKQSDALIHDCGSFLIEYLMTGKPCMYLFREVKKAPDLNRMSIDALECHYHGYTKEHIEEFLLNLLSGHDSMLRDRQSYRETYLLPQNGKTAAQNIIDTILPPSLTQASR